MNILEIIGAVVLLVLVGLAVAHALGYVSFSADWSDDD